MSIEKIKSVSHILNFTGGISGLISAAAILIAIGSYKQSMADLERRILNLEQHGSIGLQIHERDDDRRVNDLTARVVRIEDAMMKINELNVSVVRLETKLDEHVRNTHESIQKLIGNKSIHKEP